MDADCHHIETILIHYMTRMTPNKLTQTTIYAMTVGMLFALGHMYIMKNIMNPYLATPFHMIN